MTKRAKPQTYEQQFMTRTRSIYSNMQARFAEKRDKRDRIIRIGQTVPFTLQQFRERLLVFFGGSPGGSATCRYCHAWVTIEDVAADHETPVSRGGSLDLSNIGFPCKACNDRKGKLLPAEYQALYDALKAWPETARTDVLHRLQIAVQLAAKDRNNRAKEFRKQKEAQEATENGF